MRRRWLPVLAGVGWLAACTDVTAEEPLEANMADQPSTTSSPPSSPAASAPLAPARPVETTPPEPVFASAVRPAEAEDLGGSWRAGCPVGTEDLRWIDLNHWNDEGEIVTGSLVAHADHADALVTVFERLFDAAFPIHSLRPITEFDGDDNASMQANNTSAFNCREIDGRPGVWSQHAYGGAIDINPLVNPWVRGSRVDPPEGAAFVERNPDVSGLVVAGDVVTEAFAEIGWGWGGDWTSTLDYQHFSHNGL